MREGSRLLGNTRQRYGIGARLLHWSMAVLVLGLIGLGWWMVGLSYYDPWYHDASSLHEELGVVTWVVGLAFALGNLVNRPPDSLPMPWRERAAAVAAHKLLYLAVIVLPIAGYLITTADGNPLDLFGLFSVPAVVEGNETVREIATAIHTYGAYGLLGLVGVHAAAALKHHFIDRDRTLIRMIRGR